MDPNFNRFSEEESLRNVWKHKKLAQEETDCSRVISSKMSIFLNLNLYKNIGCFSK